MASLLAEARRRGVWRAAATYLVVGWLVLEVGHVLTLILELPHSAAKFLFMALVAGFPLVLALSWKFRFTSDGWFPHLPDSEPASTSENAHHGGHGGHGAVGGFDPLPLIVGILALGALLLYIFVPKDEKHAAKEAAPPAASAAAAPVAARTAPPNSVAVLPFENLSGDPGQAFFSDGMAEELRSALAAVSGLQVAARTSSNAFRTGNANAADIGGKLGVAFILEGSVRRAGNVVRISAQLVEAKTGYERWSQTYDREPKDVFAVQTDIAKIVTEALKVTLLPADAARLAARGTASIAAHDALLRGAQLFAQSGDEATFRAALAQYDAAIAADPAYAAAHAGRAATLSAIAGQFETAVQAARTNEAALAAALKAVSLKPDQADTQAALAYVLERGRLDVRGAAAAYERAYRAGPDADVLIRYGIFNVRVGDLSKGLAALNRAVALDPVNPRAWRALGTALYQARRYADALPRLDEALRLSPKLASGHAYRGDALLMLGRLPQARAAYAAETTGWARLTGLAIVEARLGNAAASDAAFAALRQDDTTGYQVAQVLAQRGDRAGALTRLEAAYAARDPGILNLRNDPLLDPLRAEPRFRALLRQLSPA